MRWDNAEDIRIGADTSGAMVAEVAVVPVDTGMKDHRR